MTRYDDLRRMREAKAAAAEKKQRTGSVTKPSNVTGHDHASATAP